MAILLAGGAQAAAAEDDLQSRLERMQRRGGEAVRGNREPPRPPEAQPAPEAPSAGPNWRPADRDTAGRRSWPRGGEGRWAQDGGAGVGGRTGQDGQDDEDWDELRQARRWGGKNGERVIEGDRKVREPSDHAPGRDRVRDREQVRPDDRGGSGWNGGRGERRRWDSHGSRPRWDRRSYPFAYVSPRRYRGSAYLPPSGFYSRSWVYGDLMPRSWFEERYWISDWWGLGLPMPPPGYVWVRYGADALLVDEFDGRVVQVVRMVFW